MGLVCRPIVVYIYRGGPLKVATGMRVGPSGHNFCAQKSERKVVVSVVVNKKNKLEREEKLVIVFSPLHSLRKRDKSKCARGALVHCGMALK